MSARRKVEYGKSTPRYPRQRWDEIIHLKYWFYDADFRKAVFAPNAWPIRGQFEYNEADSIVRCSQILLQLMETTGITSYEREKIHQHLQIAWVDGGLPADNAEMSILDNEIKIILDDILSMIFEFSTQSSEENREVWYDAIRIKENEMSEMALRTMQARWGVRDLKIWSKQDAWTIEETAALSLKLEPRYAFDLPKNYDWDVTDNINRILQERVDMVRRAVAVGELNSSYIRPSDAKKWFEKRGYWEPIGIDIDDGGTGSINTNTKNKLYSLIVAMAYEKFDANNEYGSNKISIDTAYLSALCKAYGFTLSKKSIDKYFLEIQDFIADRNHKFFQGDFSEARTKSSWPQMRQTKILK